MDTTNDENSKKENILSTSFDETSKTNQIIFNSPTHSLPNPCDLDMPIETVPRSINLTHQNVSEQPTNNLQQSEECMFPLFSDSMQELPVFNSKSPLGSIQSVNLTTKKINRKKPPKNFSFSHNNDLSHKRPSYLSQSSAGSFTNWGLRRKNSVMSVSSQEIVGYLFGSAVTSSPSHKTSRINVITDSLGIYPSFLNLQSVDVLPSSYVEAEKSNLREDEPGSPSRKESLKTRLSIEDDNLDEALASQSAPIPIPMKKRGFHPMPDVVELPENETLTAHGAARQKLAMAALAFAKTTGLPSKGEVKKDEEIKSNPKKKKVPTATLR